jgi:hypothetical protein
MKLPLQAAAVVRNTHSWPARRSSALGSPAAGVGPADWMGCSNCDNPCKRHNHHLVTCGSGTSACCSSLFMFHEAEGGACVCN